MKSCVITTDSGIRYFKTRYYPVDINKKIIYLLSYNLEGNCEGFSVKTIPIKGSRLNTNNCYKSFKTISNIPAII